jgi:hypothetical protein
MSWFNKSRVVEVSLGEQLLEAEAKLARAELLPESSFTRGDSQYNMKSGVDEKPKRIAELKAEIAYLKVKLEMPTPKLSNKEK